MFFKSMSGVDLSTETRPLPPFASIMIKGAYEIELFGKKSKNQAKVSADKVILSSIKTYVKDGILYLENERGKAFLDASRIVIEIECETVKKIHLKGAAQMQIHNVDADSLELNLLGAGNIKADKIKTDRTQVSLKGGSNLIISGSTGSFDVDQAGAGSVKAENFKAVNASIGLGGAGQASVYASEEADVRISGVGAVNVHGNPKKVNKKVSGLGSVNVI